MKTNTLGPLGQISRFTLGGGGIGHIWGPSSREESIATIHAALDGGINLIDTAPMYGNCEAIIGETFGGKLPAHVRITTKCFLGSPAAVELEEKLTQSLEASLTAMKLDRVDVLFLHSNICEDSYEAGALTAQIDRSLSPNHPETKDYDRAAPFRELCKRLGQDPAVVAHRYAMSMEGVDTVVLGVKNRAELAQCLEGERQGVLTAGEMKAIDDLGLRV